VDEHQLTVALVLLGALGLASQWVAWKFRLPAIVLLLASGLLAGPALGILRPEEQLGPMLRPVIRLAVALILFEGGLSLRLHELRHVATGVRRLVLLGVPIAWILGSVAARFVGGLSWSVALVFGAIAVVTGPTVIIPLLRHARLRRRPSSILKWEGIVNDPIGALLAVLVFGVVATESGGAALVAKGVGLTVLASAVLGGLGAWLLAKAFRRGLVPEYLKGPMLLGSALVVYLLADLTQEEAGLAAATVFGVVFGNQRLASLDELRRFKEAVIVLLVSIVFLLLTASLEADAFRRLDSRSLLLLAAMLFLVRPATVLLATMRAGIAWSERLLVAWIAPRGVVAAAVAAAFAPGLVGVGSAGADRLVPLVFALIVATVVLHGLTIGPLGRRLGLAAESRDGLLLVGANPWSIDLARTLHELGVAVTVVDSVWTRLRTARMAGLEVSYGEVLSEIGEESLERNHIGYLLAATANDAYNALVCTRFAPEIGRQRVFQVTLLPEDESDPRGVAVTHRGRIAFGEGVGYDQLLRRHYQGWRFQKTQLTESYSEEDRAREASAEGIRLLLLRPDGSILFETAEEAIEPRPGDTVVTYVPAEEHGE
jgi:NhaP-type Na+/H+ or K+/H+ antiporter